MCYLTVYVINNYVQPRPCPHLINILDEEFNYMLIGFRWCESVRDNLHFDERIKILERLQ